MAEIKLSELLKILNLSSKKPAKDLLFTNFHFDTRRLQPGGLFFALKSESNDGHNYLQHLVNIAGSAAVISKDYYGDLPPIPLIRVEDPLQAAQQVAAAFRLRSSRCRFVAVTGSAGKTTTKEFIFQLLNQFEKSYVAPYNWNNHIGVPFSILRMSGEEKFSVLEFAMSYPGQGEIDLLTKLFKPELRIILNVLPVHLEFLKTIQNIARAKTEILNYPSADSLALVNGDYPLLVAEAKKKYGQLIFFGRKKQNAIRLEKINKSKEGTILTISFFGCRVDFSTRLLSDAHLENLFVALCVCRCLGIKVAELQKCTADLQPPSNRGGLRKIGQLLVIDETYNSNPASVIKSLQWIAADFKQPKIAVLGDMLELGTREKFWHQQVGKAFSLLNFDQLLCVGHKAVWIGQAAVKNGFPPNRVNFFIIPEEAGKYLRTSIKSEAVLFVKASRGIMLEKAIAELEK